MKRHDVVTQSTMRLQKASDLGSFKSRMSRMDNASGDMDWMRGKIMLRPDDQLPLTEMELQDEIARVLTTHDTRVPDNIVEWSWKLMEFVKVPAPPHTINMINIPGDLLHKESEQAKIQMAGGAMFDDKEDGQKGGDEGEEDEGEEEEDEGEGGDEEEEEYEGEEDVKAEEAATEPDEGDEEEERSKPKKIPNQFNFCERAALTYFNPVREMATQTVPPPTAEFNMSVFQWSIFDFYQNDFARQQREKEKDRKVLGPAPKKEDLKKKAQMKAAAVNNRMLQGSKTLERMVNQNIFDDILQDYRYWDDPSDEYKEGEGSLLPLWKFSYEKTKKHDVTDLCFNHRYYDLFAVAFGAMLFESPISTGSICLFSLKNPSYPEWICHTESPVMCIDFSKNHPHLLAAGMLDGSVAVYNVMLTTNALQYKSNEVTQKHGGIVWQVCWGPDTEEGNLTFYSVSIDGRVNHWVLLQHDLGVTTIMMLFLDQPPVPGPDGTLITLKDFQHRGQGLSSRVALDSADGGSVKERGCECAGTCIAFHPEDLKVFLVGTEEGTIYKCNTAYSSVYMQTYKEAHNMPVYRIVFNKYNSRIFASCSGDWRIKIWEDERETPLFMFDLGIPIGDLQWAPYSSTVLACVSNDGKVTIFDLNVNKYKCICSQPIVSKRRNKLNRLAFNNTLPFIIVGDDNGTVTTLKLSPNLRVKVKPTKKQLHLTQADLEIMKLERLLSFVREPPVLTPPKDVRIEK